jgi:glycerol-3-phosphate dehydrogenase (NAD(P)+)
MANIGILGAGSWGNTLAFLLGQDHELLLWDHDAHRVRKASKTRRFKKPLEQKYPDNVRLSAELNDLRDCEIVINAVPLKGMDDVFSKIQALNFDKAVIFVNGSKGIHPDNLRTPTEIIRSYYPNNPVGVFSGPNLAKELIKGKPMVAVAASVDENTALSIQRYFSTPTLRVYTNSDVKGVELCAALKNIIAIAAGAVDGLQLGESAKASLITRGLNEIGRFLKLYEETRFQTLLGAAGLGDLIVTCSSDLSRNYRVGFYLSKGEKLEQIIKTLGEVAEGINTTFAVSKIASEHGLHLPIVEEVKKVLEAKSTTVNAVIDLMNRPLGSELVD